MIDTHCHVDQLIKQIPTFKGKINNLPINILINPGLYIDQWSQIHGLSHQYPKIKIALGIHPWFISENKKNAEETKKIMEEKIDVFSPVAIGECGLDGMIETQMSLQLNFFEMQLQIASEHQLPVIIHSRKTHHLILQQFKKFNLPAKGVIHGFSGSYEVAKQYTDQGFYIGIGGTITYPRANKTRKTVSKLPLKQLLLETDAPDMPIQGKQGRANSPEFLPEIAKCLGELLKVPTERIIEQTNQNALDLFTHLNKSEI